MNATLKVQLMLAYNNLAKNLMSRFPIPKDMAAPPVLIGFKEVNGKLEPLDPPIPVEMFIEKDKKHLIAKMQSTLVEEGAADLVVFVWDGWVKTNPSQFEASGMAGRVANMPGRVEAYAFSLLHKHGNAIGYVMYERDPLGNAVKPKMIDLVFPDRSEGGMVPPLATLQQKFEEMKRKGGENK